MAVQLLDHHKELLQHAGILPHNAKRIDELKLLKQGSKRTEILRKCLTTSEIHLILRDAVSAKGAILGARVGDFDSKTIDTLSGEYTHLHKDEYLDWAKVIR
jgi:hypothetical protein